ncbi:hypothetical protein CKM354_000012300 [Cercospora kikuchii]|uniref:Uncharacterized protein n=1 Tax=Cercospora kikuchii TaxID=84275 RepID=A0A9P3C3B3_9PEZI|nr:uncharacterized protein CKM354_000012300 [Cercospora kikuchii]GIZ36654.1 hypothetical protein CKM354_000012300 [Cercospora kikuchii]
MQTPGEILEMLRAIGLEGEELEMQEHLWNEARRPSTQSNDRQRPVASLATGQALGLSQSVSERNGTRPGIGLQEAGQRRQVQSLSEPAATISNLHSTGMASHILGDTVEEQSNQQPSVAGGQTTTNGDQSGQRVEPNSVLTHVEISALYTQLGMSRSQIFVCDSAAMDRLMHRLQPEQDAQPEWYTEITDRDVLYSFKLSDAMFRLYRISFDTPSWSARLPSDQERKDLLESLFDHHYEWKSKIDSYLRRVAPNLLDGGVRRLMQEEAGNPLEERPFKCF